MIDPAIAAVLKADHLSEETRRVYSKNLAMIAEAASNRALLPVLTMHADKVIQFITTKYTEVASQKTMLVSIMAVYKFLDLKAKSQASYDRYLELFDKLDGILKERSKTNLVVTTPSSRLCLSCRATGAEEKAAIWLQRKAPAEFLWRLHPACRKRPPLRFHTYAEMHK